MGSTGVTGSPICKGRGRKNGECSLSRLTKSGIKGGAVDKGLIAVVILETSMHASNGRK